MLRPVRVIGLTVTLAAPAHAQYQYPAAPANPTFQDCIDLSQEYHAILSTLYEQHRVCQNQEPQFGRAMRCNGTYGAVPWAQCQDLALTICEANSEKNVQVEICRMNSGGSSSFDQINHFNDVVSTGDQIHSVWQNASSFLNDPTLFLRNVAADRLSTELQSRLMPYQDLSPDGEELYRHLFRAARYGADQSANPVIGQIQSELLSYMEQRFADLLYQLDQVSAASAQLSAQR